MRITGNTHQPRKKAAAALAISASIPLLLGTLTAVPAQAVPGVAPAVNVQQSFQPGRYIVVLNEKPVATYTGGTAGIPATKPAQGQKLNPDSTNVKKYESYLETGQKQVAAKAGVQVKASFSTAINAFTAQLTGAQAATLARDPKVLSVTEDKKNSLDYSTLNFLNLRGDNGVWTKSFAGAKNAGKGVVVGVIDTGYSPKSPFFAGDAVKPLVGQPKVGEPYLNSDGKIAMLKSDGDTFVGDCQAGEGFAGTECNSKVLSARYFADTYKEDIPPEHRAPTELFSPVDTDSHGSHTASTAAGNKDIRATVVGKDMGITGGVAPAAKLAIYKVCWADDDPNTGGCYTSSSIEAIDQAILDGVDVINYSIGGSRDTTTDPVEMAFLSAASAGIFVSTSAGNDGPTASTVAHGAPWTTTVAATSFSSELQGTVEFADGTKFRGASMMATGVASSRIVLAGDISAAGANGALCGPNSLDPAKAKGVIVVCDRGGFDRVAKSAEVKRAGGVGMVLVNLTDNSEDLDIHSVPTVHINVPDSLKLKDKVAKNPTLKAKFSPRDTTGLPGEVQPQIAGFSSRGPLLAENSDLLKPDISAPGVNVLAAVSPIGENGETFGLLSGTSMAAPHIAGFAALALSKNPKWSPATIKSALMTTAVDVKNADGTKNTDLQATGAGNVNPWGFLDPGLVYDQTPDDYLRFVQGTGVNLGIPGITGVKARDTNVPSFALGTLTGKIEVTRTLTAIQPGTYRAVANVPGINVKVTPSILTFGAAGEKKTFKVSFEATTAPRGVFANGSLIWQGNGKSVTSPVTVRPESVDVAKALTFTTAKGSDSASIPFRAGVTGPVKVDLLGLTSADATAIELTPGPVAGANNANNALKFVDVPAGTPYAKFSVLSSDPTADFDLYIIKPDGTQAKAATASASESFTIKNPAPGRYALIANLYGSNGNKAVKASLEATVLSKNNGNATVTPNPLSLTNGVAGSFKLNWTGLKPGSYVGLISYAGTSYSTLVNIVVNAAGVSTAVPLSESTDQATRDKAKADTAKLPAIDRSPGGSRSR